MQIFRIFIVAFLFCIFGVLCLCGNIYFIPVIIFRLYKITFFRNLSRDIVRFSWRLFILACRACGYLDYEYSDFKRLKSLESCLIIANHPSLLDVVLIISHIPRINCIVKDGLKRNVFLYPAIKASGYILNTENEILLNNATKALKSGESLLVFPEGTRTKDSIIFHKASSYIAINAAKYLAMIVIKMQPRSLQKGRKWYDTPTTKIKYSVSLYDIWDLGDYEIGATNAIRVRRLHKNISEIYTKEWNNG